MRSLLTVALLLVAGPALAADDYPFSGFYGLAPYNDTTASDTLARCGLAFFDQRPDGSFVSYAVDLGAYVNDGTLAYNVTNRGQCTYDAVTKVEECAITDDYAGADDFTTYDVIASNTPEETIVTVTNDLAGAQSVAAGKTEGVTTNTQLYFRCPFNDEVVAAALTANRAADGTYIVQDLTGPAADLLASPEVKQLTKALVVK